MKIFLLDDEQECLESLSNALQPLGHEIIAEVNPFKALEFFRSQYVDVAILDVRMPGMDGMEMLRRLKDINPKTRVIICTGFANLEMAKEAVKQRASAFFEKPVNFQALVDTIRDIEKEIAQINENTKEFADLFVSEATDLIDDAEGKLSALESDYDAEAINTIFRMFHSLKGSAGFLNFSSIKRLTHEAETLLDIFRKQAIKPDVGVIDLLYKIIDLMRTLVASVDSKLSDGGYYGETDALVIEITNCINALGVAAAPRDEECRPASVATIAANAKDDAAFDSSLITPEMFEKYILESCDLLDGAEQGILALEKKTSDRSIVNDVFRNMHTFKGNSGFFGFAELEAESGDLETFLDTIRSGETTINNNLISFLLNKIDVIRDKLKQVADGNVCADPDRREKDGHSGRTPYKPIGQILVDLGEATPDAVSEALEKQHRSIGEILVEDHHVRPEAVEKALQMQQTVALDRESAPVSASKKYIRVSTDRLDKLFDLVGELITAEAMVEQHPDIRKVKRGTLRKSVNYLAKITRELQEMSMDTRMIPIEGIFTRMVRLVRDLSRKDGKKVTLVLSGQETEIDKNVIEEISDPLVHIIRNSIDHGIESPSARMAAGKPEQGSIELSARYEGNEIWISIKDDGKGLDREKIIAKARSRGMLETDGSELDDARVWRFIFEPGFSTADKVTEVSGRGVGMDVVKKNVEKLKGKIDIASVKNQGTEFTLKIPLTLAILDGITITVGGNLYSIPVTDIIEFFKAGKNHVVKLEEGVEMIRLRDAMLPIIRLHEVFKLGGERRGLNEGILVVVHNGERKACFLIDDIVGGQQIVIKSLSDYIGDQKGFSGCSVMGNGEIALIIDTSGILDLVLHD